MLHTKACLLAAIICLPVPVGRGQDQVPIDDGALQSVGPRSALIGPLHLGEAPPELRTLGAIWISEEASARVPGSVERTREQALELAAELSTRLRDGENWYEVSSVHSAMRNRDSGGVLGSVVQGMLLPEFDRFLFSSELGEISDPVATARGVFVLKRLETRAGCRMIVVRGVDLEARSRMLEILEHLDQGREFADLAREYSSHAGSAGRGGQWAIFERGNRDSHIKLAVFRAAIGEVVGPIEGGTSLYLVQRVAASEIDSTLAENNWIRARSIVLSYDNAPEGLRPNPRDADEAATLLSELRTKILDGEEMATLAERHHDDPSGRERAGDLGWIHRYRPSLPRALKPLWLKEIGGLSRVVDVKIGYGVFRREG